MPKPTVLVVDDDRAVRDAVAEDLKRENYDLHFASNGLEGLRMARDTSPTVIILDLRMPVMGGLDFLEQIQLKPPTPTRLSSSPHTGTPVHCGRVTTAGRAPF